MLHFPSITGEELDDASRRLHDRMTRDAGRCRSWCHVEYDLGVLSIRKEYVVDQLMQTEESTRDAWTGGNHVGLERDDTNGGEGVEVEDDDDDEVVRKPAGVARAQTITVDFSICRSPTYEVPVLWFTLSHIPPGSSGGFGAVYRYLVPETKRPGVREIGVLGGISIANHPISDVPAFFIHPCRTAEALAEIGVGGITSAEEYLILWLGLVGPCVDLYIPSQLLHQDHAPMDGARRGAANEVEKS